MSLPFDEHISGQLVQSQSERNARHKSVPNLSVPDYTPEESEKYQEDFIQTATKPVQQELASLSPQQNISILNQSSVLSPSSRNFPGSRKKLQPNVSRDEMNLAEFPLAVLSTRVDTKLKTLEFTDYSRGPQGEMIERRWIITGADKFGLPTATDDDVVLGLIRLSMDQGFREPKVYFTRYELLKTLRWSTEGRSYQRLIKSLDRLSGVRIRSSNSFYDNASKSYQTSNFGIIDAYEINDERAGKGYNEGSKSFFIWSEMLFDSFKSGYIKKLDLDLYFGLKSAIARRLYRYLDKHFYFKNVLEAHLYTLAFEKIGLSRTYKYVSSIRQQLTPALKELVSVGFLSSYEFIGDGQSTMLRFVATNGNTSALTAGGTNSKYPQPGSAGAIHVRSNRAPQNKMNFNGATQTAINQGKETTLDTKSNSVPSTQQALVSESLLSDHENQKSNILNQSTNHSQDLEVIHSLKADITDKLLERGIAERQSQRLLSSQGLESLKKIIRIISYYDDLRARADKKVSLNPVGFLYRAVESPYKITLPDDLKSSENFNTQSPRGADLRSSDRKSVRPEHRIFKAQNKPVSALRTGKGAYTGAGDSAPNEIRKKASRESLTDSIPSNDPRRQEYRSYIENEINCIMTRIAPIELGELFAETENKMKSLKRILGVERFQEAVEGCVRDELKRRFRLPSFDAWLIKGTKHASI